MAAPRVFRVRCRVCHYSFNERAASYFQLSYLCPTCGEAYHTKAAEEKRDAQEELFHPSWASRVAAFFAGYPVNIN